MPVQNSNSKFLLVQIYLLIYFTSLFQQHLIAFCVKKGNLQFSHVLEEGLLGQYLAITPKKAKLKILHRNLCLSKEVSFTKLPFRKLPVQKTG